MVITVEQAKAQLDALIDRSTAGEEVVITRGGRPVARMVAVDAGTGNGAGGGAGLAPERAEPRRLGSAKGLFRVSDDFDAPLEDFREYME